MTNDINFKKNSEGAYAVPCQIKMVENCLQTGEFFENEEKAREWVEDDCWIFSGEGFICPPCNEQIFFNLGKIRGKHSP